MAACENGHIEIVRMLVGEYHANIDIQNTVRAIMRLLLCGYVRTCVRRYAHGSGGWECRGCRRGWHIYDFCICNNSLNDLFVIIAPEDLVIIDVVYSLSDLFDFIILVYIFHFQSICANCWTLMYVHCIPRIALCS